APFIFAVWLTAAVILWKRYEIKPKHVIAFFAGMIITALPVIIFAFMKPDVYFQYFNHANPNKGGAVLGYLQTISRNLMYYVKMFSVQSDGDYSIHIDDAPLIDDVTGIFFPAAFFISLIFFFRPSQMFMLLVFFAGMLPALLGGGGFAHPTERRVIMALPAIYLFSAMALDLIRSGLMEKGFKKTWTAVFSILIIAAFIVAGNTGIKFFFKYSGSPYETIGYGRMYKEAGDFLRANKKMELYASPRLKSDVAEFMTMPHELPVNYCVSYEDALKTAPEKGFAIAADGYFVYTQGIFNEIYGNPFFKAHKEKFLDSKLMKHWVYGLKTEPYFVGNYLTTISVSPEQSKSAAGMMVIKEGGMTA
ncbi:MAG TPA: hypothetical protein PKJ42_10145, partial [Candidatus Goldiibacteriota bacterium]|nr:hypothetical protein [Candidatus Goldiibacteriota bacterium]